MAFDNQNDEISRKHGTTFVHTLRRTYGPGFASGCADNARLSDCLTKLDEPSLTRLVRDQTVGSSKKFVERGDRASRVPR
jgi:hypothetical protein